MVIVNEETWDLVSKGNSSVMNNAKIVNNSQPLCGSLQIPHYVHMKHTIPVISVISVRGSPVQCNSIRQMLYIFYTQKLVGFMMLLSIHHCWSRTCVLGTKRENSFSWKSFQSNMNVKKRHDYAALLLDVSCRCPRRREAWKRKELCLHMPILSLHDYCLVGFCAGGGSFLLAWCSLWVHICVCVEVFVTYIYICIAGYNYTVQRKNHK